MPAPADRAIVDTLRDVFPEAEAVYLFGSRAQGAAGPASDWDIGVLLPRPAPPVTVWDAAAQVAAAIDADVDLVDLRAASTVMQHQAIPRGRRLWQRGSAGALFECFVMGEKCALDAARAGYLADIAARGSVYG